MLVTHRNNCSVVNTFTWTGLLLDKKRTELKDRAFNEKKQNEISPRLEHSPQKSL
jgi:hypothetical protein